MPYEIVPQGGKFVLRKKHGDKKVFGRHPSRAAAEAQLRAILANSHGEGANMPKDIGSAVSHVSSQMNVHTGFNSLSQGRRVEVRRG